jgi:hypothetical protein
MRWPHESVVVAAAFLAMSSFQAPARAADAGLLPAAETRTDVNRHRTVRVYAPRRHVVRAYPRYRIVVRPRIVWQVDASSAQPAYVLP